MTNKDGSSAIVTNQLANTSWYIVTKTHIARFLLLQIWISILFIEPAWPAYRLNKHKRPFVKYFKLYHSFSTSFPVVHFEKKFRRVLLNIQTYNSEQLVLFLYQTITSWHRLRATLGKSDKIWVWIIFTASASCYSDVHSQRRLKWQPQ